MRIPLGNCHAGVSSQLHDCKRIGSSFAQPGEGSMPQRGQDEFLGKALDPLSLHNWTADFGAHMSQRGVLDLRTGDLRPARSGDRITLHSSVEYDPPARCQRFEQFLNQIFRENDERLRSILKLAVSKCNVTHGYFGNEF